MHHPRLGGAQRRGAAGFTLVELLLALGLGAALFGVLLQALLLHGQGSERLVRQLRERAVQRRALELMRSEVLRAERLLLPQAGAPALPAAALPCPLAGRRPVLHLQTPHGTVLYSVGAPPSEIWRGQVLMRCGPAFGLDGEPSEGISQNRVLLDALAAGGFVASRPDPLRLQLQLRQQFRLRDGALQEIRSALEMATAELES